MQNDSMHYNLWISGAMGFGILAPYRLRLSLFSLLALKPPRVSKTTHRTPQSGQPGTVIPPRYQNHFPFIACNATALLYGQLEGVKFHSKTIKSKTRGLPHPLWLVIYDFHLPPYQCHRDPHGIALHQCFSMPWLPSPSEGQLGEPLSRPYISVHLRSSFDTLAQRVAPRLMDPILVVSCCHVL